MNTTFPEPNRLMKKAHLRDLALDSLAVVNFRMPDGLPLFEAEPVHEGTLAAHAYFGQRLLRVLHKPC
jgi:hypothetical protein